MRAFARPAPPVVLAALTAVACGGSAVVGQVTDVTGAPLADSRVTAVGTLCQTPTDDEGRFRLKCSTEGDLQLIVTQTGYVSKELTVPQSDASEQDLGQVLLIKIPDGDGLFLFDGATYATMSAGVLGRTADPTDKAFCLDRAGSTPNRVVAGPVPLYEKAVDDDWRLYKLDAEGCARRLRREGTTWSITWSEKAEMTTRDVEYEQKVHIATLPAGEYFLAWWRGGTFVTASAKGADGGDRYAGYWIVAE